MIKQLRVIYVCVKAVTIGNGIGRHAFQEAQTFSQKHLESCQLTKGQINSFFKRKEIYVDPR